MPPMTTHDFTLKLMSMSNFEVACEILDLCEAEEGETFPIRRAEIIRFREMAEAWSEFKERGKPNVLVDLMLDACSQSPKSTPTSPPSN